MARTLKVGIIGCGAIGERLHIPDIAVCPEGELVAFCDTSKARAKAMAEKFAPDAGVYTDYKKLLKDERVQAVCVLLPNKFHAPVTIAAAKAGRHVFVEKPMANSSAECKKMIDACNKAGVTLMVNQGQRRIAAHRKAKEVLESGILGRVNYVSGLFGHAGPEHWSPTGKWFFRKEQARFGAMADLGVHKADIIRYLTGKEIVEVGAFTATLEKKGATVEDNFSATVKFDDGTLGMFGASWTTKGAMVSYTMFHCENGNLYVGNPGDENTCWAELHDPECRINFEEPEPLNEYEDSWGVDVGGGFVRACLGLEEPFCSGEEGKKSMEVILAAEKSALTKRIVKVKQ